MTGSLPPAPRRRPPADPSPASLHRPSLLAVALLLAGLPALPGAAAGQAASGDGSPTGRGLGDTSRARPAPAPPGPYSRITVSLSGALDVAEGSLQERWDPRPALELAVSTPFHLGHVELGAERGEYAAREAGLRDFSGWFFFAGWGLAASLPAGLEGRIGLRSGLFHMRLDSAESELGFTLVAALRRPLIGGWSLRGSVRHRTVLTHERIRQLHLTAGLARTLTTPAWLEDFLR